MTLPRPAPKKFIWAWFVWLAVFYLVWWFLMRNDWGTVLAHLPIAAAMALGSYAAGSTPMGGGTVGFPVLVLFFDLPASLGRDFSFAVQAVGMVSASIFILAWRTPLAGSMLKGAILGSLIGLPFGIVLVAPLVPDLWVKVVFAVVWGSFGILHLYRIDEIAGNDGMVQFDERWDLRLGCGIGLAASALIVSVTGVGIDMVIYAALVLLSRADLKIAIPTSVLIMAFNSAIGVAVKSATHTWQPGVYENWLAAAPVVALGAPLGAFFVDYIGRKTTLLLVATLCLGQFFWTCHAERHALGLGGIVSALLALGLFLALFEWLRVIGHRLIVRNAKRLERTRTHGAGPRPVEDADSMTCTT